MSLSNPNDANNQSSSHESRSDSEFKCSVDILKNLFQKIMKKVRRIASFTLFSNDFKSKLTTAYPFLSADQIQMKLRQKWKKLSPQEKERYHKDVACSAENIVATKKKAGKQTKTQSKSPRKSSKDAKVDLKELTLFDDDLKLHYVDVSKKFSPDNVFDMNDDDKFYEDFKITPKKSLKKSTKTYKGSTNNVEKPVPLVIDETPFGQQGILKKSSSDKAKKRKVQFDFSMDQEQFGEHDYYSISSDEEMNAEEMTTKPLKNERITSKSKTRILNDISNFDRSRSNEEAFKNITLENDKLNPNLDSSKEIEPLTPELQRNSSPMIIEKMCDAPKKKPIKSNYTTIEKIRSGKKMPEALSIGNLNKLPPRRRSTSESGSPSDDLHFENEELKTIFTDNSPKNTSITDLKMLDTTQTDSYRSDDFFHSLSPFSDSDVHWNDSVENINTSIGWETSDVSPSNKNSSSIEKTIQLLKKSVSSSLTSIVHASPDHLPSDCSSPLSVISEFSGAELEMSDISDDEVLSDEFASDEKLYATGGVTPSGDFNNHYKIPKENKVQNANTSLLCDLFDETRSTLTRLLPPPGNSGEKIAHTTEDDSIFA